ncbi:DUF4442 domain-containing protein [Gallaecimonas kandeliae]|uniref:DUF4442 domain-containing protein n=1 Tax=Gallaecimonas kandeliae TaxID=3029055 RepID=UPI002647FCCD|nr:DUF4442 domain-containing protein [Gallaecimonas kandeliae]WKE67191.1 DUF4442 domain-containing protein [Gallaecimonas kandeliae]
MKSWLFKKGSRIKHLLNLWPPFFFTGIRIRELSDDFRLCRVELKDRPWTKNANGTQFGGSLFAMTDPIYALMLMGILGKRYHVWDRAARIHFEKPGTGKVYAEFIISEPLLEEIAAATGEGEKFLPEVVTDVKDAKGELVARIERTLYVRLKRHHRPA